MSPGILEMLGSVATLVSAIPPAFAGVGLLLRGNPIVGGSLLGVALGMVAVDRYVTTPGDLPELIASKVVGAVVRSPDEE
jgi:hypothetical protein